MKTFLRVKRVNWSRWVVHQFQPNEIYIHMRMEVWRLKSFSLAMNNNISQRMFVKCNGAIKSHWIGRLILRKCWQASTSWDAKIHSRSKGIYTKDSLEYASSLNQGFIWSTQCSLYSRVRSSKTDANCNESHPSKKLLSFVEDEERLLSTYTLAFYCHRTTKAHTFQRKIYERQRQYAN